MSTFLDRIRARTRRANAKRAKRLGLSRTALEPLLAPHLPSPDSELLEGDGSDQPEGAELEATDTTPAVVNAESEPSDAASQVDTTDELAAREDLVTAAEPEPAPAASVADYVISRLEFPKSSNLRAASLGVDGVLMVDFANGSRYRYANFTLELMAEWEAAKSAGSWFHNNVRTKPDRHPIVEA